MKRRKLLAMLLAVVMAVSLCPIKAQATPVRSTPAPELPSIIVGESQEIFVAVNEPVEYLLRVEESGYYGIYTNDPYVHVFCDENFNGTPSTISSLGKRQLETEAYTYFYFETGCDYTVQFITPYTDLNLIFLVGQCTPPTALSIPEAYYCTVGSGSTIPAEFGGCWEFGATEWNIEDEQVLGVIGYDGECHIDPLAPGQTTVTARTKAADGTILTVSCSVTVYPMEYLTTDQTYSYCITNSLNFRFIPETAGYYAFSCHDHVSISFYDLDWNEPSHMNFSSSFLTYLEAGKEYQLYLRAWDQGKTTPMNLTIEMAQPLVLGIANWFSVQRFEERWAVFIPEQDGIYSCRGADDTSFGFYDNDFNYVQSFYNSAYGYSYCTTALEAGKAYLIQLDSNTGEYIETDLLIEEAVMPDSLEFNIWDTTSIKVGESIQLNAYLMPGNAYSVCTWSVSDEAIASLDIWSMTSCELTGLAPGEVTVTCETENGIRNSITILVIEPIALLPDETMELIIAPGNSVSLSCAIPEDGAYVMYHENRNLYIDGPCEDIRMSDGDISEAVYFIADAGDILNFSIQNNWEEVQTTHVTLTRVRTPQQIIPESNVIHAEVASQTSVRLNFDSLLAWDIIKSCTVDDESIATVHYLSGPTVFLDVWKEGVTTVTLTTENGLTASCELRTYGMTGGELQLNKPADVRLLNSVSSAYTFTPVESGEYSIIMNMPVGVSVLINDIDYSMLEFVQVNAGSQEPVKVTLSAGITYFIRIYGLDTPFAEGTICIKDNYVPAEIATGWSGAAQWTLTEDGVLTIYGSGNMKNYGYAGGQPWLNKGVDITSVVIEEGVTGVGSGAFMNLTTLESVTFPENSLAKMGEAAFYGSGLTTVEIPASLWTIQPYTFKNCADLTEVTFNEGNLQKISDGAFYGTGLTELVLPDCLDILDVYAFKGCSKLTDITISSGLTELREAVFYGTAIPTIEIPEGITKIGPYAFKNCMALENIDLPESLTSVGEASFYACTGLEEIILPDAVKTIGNYAFRKCAAIEELSFGEELETIGECAFYGCTGLTELVIPDKVTTIKPYAFKTCTGLASVTLGKSVKTIGEGAFNTCPGLKTIVFPASVTSIGDYCFSGNANLWKLTFEGNAPAIGTGAFKGLNAYAYYPGSNTTWNSSNMLNYGGKLTWKPL